MGLVVNVLICLQIYIPVGLLGTKFLWCFLVSASAKIVKVSYAVSLYLQVLGFFKVSNGVL